MNQVSRFATLAIGLSFVVTACASGVPTDFTKAAESTVNGVVSIKSYVTTRSSQQQGYYTDPFSDPFFDFFFGPQQRRQPTPRQQEKPQQRQTGLGSGVILSSDGYIVTNNHVIDGAEELEVTLNDNRTFNATVVGADPTTDVALIKIDADDLHVIPMGDSEDVKVGEWVLAVGNPFGFTSTVTAGIVSAKGRSISSLTGSASHGIESFIQTDAAVNPGNSGGALVTLNGELIGINTAIYSQTGNYAGYSFAIPTSIVKKVVADLKEYGTVQRAVMGISFGELTQKLAKEEGITATNYGLYIGSVEDRSAAMEAGLKKGDVIIAIDDVPMRNTANLQEAVAKKRPGDTITVNYIRDNKEYSTKVTLRNSSGTTSITRPDDFTALGCAFKSLSDETKEQLQLTTGVQVSGLKDGKFKDAGIKDGFIILTINDVRVNSQDDVEKVYKAIMKSNATDKAMFIVGLYPTGRKAYYAVDLAN
ncbi:MAG: Do family serine endopeptidase [Bacteroidales bacterium]|nr:Do family serine endopeptidase [Bacteroidales bacterium]